MPNPSMSYHFQMFKKYIQPQFPTISYWFSSSATLSMNFATMSMEVPSMMLGIRLDPTKSRRDLAEDIADLWADQGQDRNDDDGYQNENQRVFD